MQRELDAAALQFSDHRHHWRDADAAGQQQMPFGALGEREIVARQCRLDGVADPDLVMQSARALALAEYRNAIAPAFGRVIPQGIIAPPPLSSGIAEPHPDMRP